MTVNVNYVIIVKGDIFMNEKFKSLIFALDTKGLLELFYICNMRYFDLCVDGNIEYANRYKAICASITQELRNRNIWK